MKGFSLRHWKRQEEEILPGVFGVKGEAEGSAVIGAFSGKSQTAEAQRECRGRREKAVGKLCGMVFLRSLVMGGSTA